MKKGISLPINTLIIVVLGIVILLTLIGVFTGVFNPSSSTTSSQAAVKATCKKVNPRFCNNGKYDFSQPRMPVYDFDANKDGKINDFHPDGSALTTYCIDDNLETLCGFYFGCNLPGKIFSDKCRPTEPGFDPADPTNYFIVTPEEAQEWYDCCVKRICGC